MDLIFHHIGIYCQNIKKDKIGLIKSFNLIEESEIIQDEILNVRVQFYTDKNNKIRYELIEPNGVSNPVSNTLMNEKNYLNHMAYSVRDLDKSIFELRKQNFIPIDKIKFAKAFQNNIQFFYTPFKTIIELIQL